MATLKCLLHPHHISLIDTSSWRAKLHNVGDPYYNIDGLASHRNVLSPKFDIFETDSHYVLIGELPGLAQDSQVHYEWLGNQTLFVHGHIDRTFGESRATDAGISKTTKTLHLERHVGDFERSFTLPEPVNTDVEHKLENGVMTVRIPKLTRAAREEESIRRTLADLQKEQISPF